jgi:hypothetical protein
MSEHKPVYYFDCEVGAPSCTWGITTENREVGEMLMKGHTTEHKLADEYRLAMAEADFP